MMYARTRNNKLDMMQWLRKLHGCAKVHNCSWDFRLLESRDMYKFTIIVYELCNLPLREEASKTRKLLP